MQATTATARAIVDLVTKCGALIAEEKNPLVHREPLAELLSLDIVPFPDAQRDAELTHLMNTARELAKLKALARPQ